MLMVRVKGGRVSEYIYTDEGMPDSTCELIRRFYRREEIVRCKDCKKCITEFSYCDSADRPVEPDGFCKWGERRLCNEHVR